jgi:predicted regulator of Ras-like GTPase activity (Roadblock/LC7/MglB family)
MYEAESKRIQEICDDLTREANAKVVTLVDKDGQLMASAGQTSQLDTTSLASLAAGNIAATGGIAKLINEKEFSQTFHEGERDNLYLSLIGQQGILVVIFDARTNLGLVRLRVRKKTIELKEIMDRLSTQAASSTGFSPFAEITDEDIDSLFAN